MTPLNELPPPYDKPLFAGKFQPKDLDDWLNLNLGNYLERLQQSEAMMGELEKYLLGGDRPVVLMHFGDHQPSFDGAMMSRTTTLGKCSRAFAKASAPSDARKTL